MIKKLILCVGLILGLNVLYGQEAPKREFRAVWIATVGNIDWPSRQGLDAETQKQEFLAILRQAKQNNMNALIVQIRPAADALYNSPFENWSRYLSGKQGEAPMPYYDPLTFMVEECHKECIEFHAWFNPYRALVDANKNLHTATHPTRTHPEWFVNYGGKRYFDPGLPEVREYFTNVVLDVVKRYDIDAVHFDDYFYPYRIAGQEFPDYKSYAKYGAGKMSKDDWRRDNVNVLIEDLSKRIKQTKSFVKFGISPFGVWRNASKDPEGSFTNGGQTNYDDLYADVLLWLKKGWIDYVLPQLYWEQGHKAADYIELLRWWNEHSYGKHCYIGHGIYQLSANAKKVCWRNMHEVITQVDALRKKSNVQGSAFYSANYFKKNVCGLNESIQSEIYTSPSLLPRMPWIEMPNVESPVLAIAKSRNGDNVLSWVVESNANLQYAVYRFRKNELVNLDNSNSLIAITRDRKYVDKQVTGMNYKYVVTALDRHHNESKASNTVE